MANSTTRASPNRQLRIESRILGDLSRGRSRRESGASDDGGRLPMVPGFKYGPAALRACHDGRSMASELDARIEAIAAAIASRPPRRSRWSMEGRLHAAVCVPLHVGPRGLEVWA